MLIGLLAAPVVAQLDEDDIAALRARGKAEGWTFNVALNGATGYALEELCGAVMPDGWEEEVSGDPPEFGRSLPAAWDWRDHNGCTPIRNQGGCGSCWAFSAVGAIESSILINEGWSVNLSEQWLVSCSEAGDCGGGWTSGALNYLTCHGGRRDDCGDCGPVRESDFPYVGWNAPCGCPYDHPYDIDGWGRVSGNLYDIEFIKQAIYDYGPVSVTVAVDSAFQGYDDGIFNACTGDTVNHAVVLVGWDDNQGSNGVWILRNSWGSWWGEGGYMRIEYACSKVGGSACYVEYRYDCNNNDIPDEDEIDQGLAEDCNGNNVPDECDIERGSSTDCNNNGIPDSCEARRLTRLYVDSTATGANTGASWNDALTSLEAAYCYTQIDGSIDEVWVARGVYTPVSRDGNSRSATFRLASGVAIYGGFAGTETSLAQRDLGNPENQTILSGDIFGDDEPGFINYWDNSYHVVRCDDADETARLDGFTITAGYADGSGIDARGAGIYIGGGSPMIVNCMLVGNYATIAGGAMSVEWGMNGLGSSPTIVNCVMVGNRSEAIAGGIYNNGEFLAEANPTLINCTVAGNTSEYSSGLYSTVYSLPTVTNCIVWGNSDSDGMIESSQIACDEVIVNYSCIQGLTGELGGVGNRGGNPSLVDLDGADDFVGTLDDDVHLRPGSACIDAGDNAAMPGGIDTDLEDNPRFLDDTGMPDTGNAIGEEAIIDMGAFEFQGITCFGDLNGDNTIDLADLSALLANYGSAEGVSYADGDIDGNGVVDLGDLSALLGRYGSSCF